LDTTKIETKTSNLLRDNNCISLPIDVLDLAIKLGVRVEAESFEDDISGLFVIKNKRPYICYNKNQGKSRVRFTIAHELGHYILHSKTKPLFIDRNKKVLYRDFNSSTGELKLEREANTFAASLLMPKFLIEAELENKNEEIDIVKSLSEKFNVSSQAMSFRLANLDYDFGMF